ncbi:MAG: hypothetical protein ACK4YP_24225 [Myxococcota bacterium]
MRWGFVFLACPLKLTEEQRHSLVRLAATAWFTDQSELRFDWEGCEGVLRVASDVTSLGTFTGQKFTAEVNLPDTSGEVQFLVAEHHLKRVEEA